MIVGVMLVLWPVYFVKHDICSLLKYLNAINSVPDHVGLLICLVVHMQSFIFIIDSCNDMLSFWLIVLPLV